MDKTNPTPDLNRLAEIIATKLKEQLQTEVRKYQLNSKPFLSIDDVAEMLEVSRDRVYAYIRNRQLPHYKNGNTRRIFFSPKDVRDFVLRNRIEADDIALSEAELQILSGKY
ncbi:helix-turn-helix domain-containing protein [Limibacter armeniacum]|uniref:helix-turn-helix domain-containing protein n=1 Tax=Limibacter armeniacum TaxID=466084 RepID=UPI002FE59EDE